MPNYVRAYIPGGSYFFTVNLLERKRFLLVENIDSLRNAFWLVKQQHPFHIAAIVVLPDHLHCIWVLPHGDFDFSTRWRLIKSAFSRTIEPGERISKRWKVKSERGIWQQRFWEHAIRDQSDFDHHLDYIHYNPVKHGLVEKVSDWPHSSFHRFVRLGYYPANWSASPELNSLAMEGGS
jgi:putative transposase